MDRPWADVPYVRIYASLARDYPQVWANAPALGTYVQLLAIADGMFPAPAPLPRRVRVDALAALTAAGLIRVAVDDTFQVAGLRKEREGRGMGRRAGGLARAASAVRASDGSFLPGHDAGENAGNASDAGQIGGPAASWEDAGGQQNQVSRDETRRERDEGLTGPSRKSARTRGPGHVDPPEIRP
jgi:hypothetical protein